MAKTMKMDIKKRVKPATEPEMRVAREWALRQLASNSLHDFVRQAWPVLEPDQKFVDNWHIQGICKHLEAVTDSIIMQLLINVPPGTMKSMLVSVLWCAWVWTKNPGSRWIFASYNENLAYRDSVKCRKLVQSEWYQNNWGEAAIEIWGELLPDKFQPVIMAGDQNQKKKYETTVGGFRIATSTASGPGEHPDYIVFDDPHKVTEVESETERQNVLEWWDGTMSLRGVTRGVRRVGVMQRLHSNDLAGHCLGKKGWDHICLPMRYEAPERQDDGTLKSRMSKTVLGWVDPRTQDGELLWPAMFTEPRVANLEAELGQYHAAGQLQQRPAPRGGGKFKREWFKIVTAIPELQNIVRYWDKAGTKGGTGAQTSGVLLASYANPQATLPSFRTLYIILDVECMREEAAQREARIKQVAEMDKVKWGYVTTWVEQEPGSGGKESAQSTIGNLAGFTCMVERVTGAKEVRCDPLASQASVGKVTLLVGVWNKAFLDEIESFPMGKLKDQVDASGGAFNKLFEPTGAFDGSAGLHTGKVVEASDSMELDLEELIGKEIFENSDLSL